MLQVNTSPTSLWKTILLVKASQRDLGKAVLPVLSSPPGWGQPYYKYRLTGPGETVVQVKASFPGETGKR